MTIYWALPIFAVVFYWLCKMTAKNGHRHMQIQIQNSDIKAYFVVMSLFMVIIIGLRSENVGIDSDVYYSMYKNMSKEDFSYILEPYVNDRGYYLLTIFTNRIGLNFYTFNIVYAVFNVGVISYLIYKYSDMPWLSYLLYIFFDFFVLELTMVRQTLAMSIVILAVLKDKNETLWDFVKFAIMILCATTIHTSSLVCIFLWFVKKIPYNTKLIIVLCVIMAATLLFKSQLGQLITYIAHNLSDKYENYQAEKGNMGLRLYFMVLASVILGIFLRRFLKEKQNIFMFYCMCIMLIIFPTVQSGGAIMRIYQYFYIFMITYVPNMINGLDKKKDKIIYLIIIALYLIVGGTYYGSYFKYDDLEVLPYEFFWQK